MSWYRTDDNITLHPKWVAVKRAALKRHKEPAIARAAAQRAALTWFALGVWGARSNCDGIFPLDAADQMASGMFMTEDELIEGADLLLAGGMLERLTKAKGGDGPGWFVRNWKRYQKSREQVEREKSKQDKRDDLYKTVEGRQIVATVKRRDGDYCRYCWSPVVWADRRSAKRGTLDHVDPEGPNSVENLVVACGSCNRRKSDRTPAEAGMELKQPYMASSRPVGQPCDLPGSKREQNANDSRPVLTRGSGRVRSGQVGSDRDGSERDTAPVSEPSYDVPRSDEAPPHTDEDAPAEGGQYR